MEIELGYDEIKSMRWNGGGIRSKSPERVAQSSGDWRCLQPGASRDGGVAAELGVPPRQISFEGLDAGADLFMWAAVPVGKSSEDDPRAALDMQHLVLPPRRSERRYPRHVKIK